MSDGRSLTSAEIREIGELLYGPTWQGDMAKALGVPRQSIGYYLKSGGANGAQASALVGLVARMLLREGEAAENARKVVRAREVKLAELLRRIERV